MVSKVTINGVFTWYENSNLEHAIKNVTAEDLKELKEYTNKLSKSEIGKIIGGEIRLNIDNGLLMLIDYYNDPLRRRVMLSASDLEKGCLSYTGHNLDDSNEAIKNLYRKILKKYFSILDKHSI